MTTVDVDVFLDLREWGTAVRDAEEFIGLWDRVERAMRQQTLAPGRVHRVPLDAGEVRVGLARARPGFAPVVRPETRFRIVNVLEAPKLRQPCGACARLGRPAHGAFRCVECPDTAEHWRCADHVDILDGSLAATCEQHRPRCVECGQPGTFRCPGPRCHGRAAHCGRHRSVHSQDPDLAYCPPCFADGFPACTAGSCRNIGAVPCEHTDDKLRRCGVRMCALHLGRWQVYGAERLGLALCQRHQQSLTGTRPERLIRRIVAGTYLRATERYDADPLPSLQALAHTLRNQNHTEAALNYRWIHETLAAAPAALGSAPGLAAMLQERDAGQEPPPRGAGGDPRLSRPRIRRGWRDELKELRRGADAGQQLVERLRQVVRQKFGREGERLATALALAEYKEPKVINDEQRPGLLFVRVPADQQQLFKRGRAHFGQQLTRLQPLGVQVEIERGDLGGRR
jgi:hypothetical protein